MIPDLAAPDMIKFGIESKFSCSTTSTEHFKKAIALALENMHNMCQEVTKQNSIQVEIHSNL